MFEIDVDILIHSNVLVFKIDVHILDHSNVLAFESGQFKILFHVIHRISFLIMQLTYFCPQ